MQTHNRYFKIYPDKHCSSIYITDSEISAGGHHSEIEHDRALLRRRGRRREESSPISGAQLSKAKVFAVRFLVHVYATKTLGNRMLRSPGHENPQTLISFVLSAYRPWRVSRLPDSIFKYAHRAPRSDASSEEERICHFRILFVLVNSFFGKLKDPKRESYFWYIINNWILLIYDNIYPWKDILLQYQARFIFIFIRYVFKWKNNNYFFKREKRAREKLESFLSI